MSQFEEIPSPGRGFQGSRALGGLAACKTLASKQQAALVQAAVLAITAVRQPQARTTATAVRSVAAWTNSTGVCASLRSFSLALQFAHSRRFLSFIAVAYYADRC